MEKFPSHCRTISQIVVCLVFTCVVASSIASLHAQTTSTWSGGAGSWSDCPPGGNALWSTCPDPPNGLGWPNGNFNVVITGGPVSATSASIVNMSIGSGASLLFPAGTAALLQVTGTSIVNNGSIVIDSGNGLSILGPTLTISGTGSISIGNSRFTGSSAPIPTVTLQQTVAGNGAFALGMNLINQGTINATGGTLEMQPTSVVNTGTFEASSGGTLQFSPGFPVPFNNTGGTIEALSGGSVQLYGSTYTGGTLTTVGTGVVVATGDAILNNVDNTGTLQIQTTAAIQASVTNSGTIQVPSATLDADGAATITGSGSILLSGTANMEQFTGSDSLTNEQLIHGAGTIYELPLTNKGTISADSKGNFLYLAGSTTTNTGTLEASGGGTLEIESVIDNTGGTIEALTGSTVILSSDFNASINGGTLTTSGTGVIESENGLLDGTVNVPTNAGSMKVNNFDLLIQGTVNNTGTITLSGNSCLVINQPATLTGTGKVVMASTTCFYGSGNSFTNQSTIQGSGTIGDSNPMPITNSGTIMATQTTPLIINSGSYGFSNSGKLSANSGCSLNIEGTFNNLSGAGTLTGGTYNVTGTLGLPGGIVSNAASITLTGSKAEILNSSTSANALAGLTSNTTTGALSVQSGQALTIATSLTNSGKATVGTGSSLTISGTYTQSGGTTTVDGTLTATSGLTLQKGSLIGKGSVAAHITSNGTVTAGDSSTKPGTLAIGGSYSQQSKGVFDIFVGGTTAGTFGDLAVSNGVSLGGALTIKLVNGFVPVVGDSFKIVTGSAVTGTFATVNGTSINSSEHFEVNYGSTSVTLTVVSGT